MGLFDMFKKKECCICGDEVGMLGNRKLADGNMCSKCTRKLSPWFEDRKESTMAQIKAQLAYREQNADELKSFQPDRVYGDYEYMFVEERDGVPYRFCVSRDKDYLEENADLVLVQDVTEVIIDIDDNANEHVDEENPDDVTYDLSYRFSVNLLIKNNPYFDNIHFDLNSGDVEVFGVQLKYHECENPEEFEYFDALYPAFVAKYKTMKRMCDEIEAMCR